jgi:hypothetical protein
MAIVTGMAVAIGIETTTIVITITVMITATVMDTTTAVTTAGIERRALQANGPESHPFWRVAFLLRRYLTRAASPIKQQPQAICRLDAM